ncbi:MAG: multicopper oxidase domain-containing protein [Candidatus Eremiobacteraeota bacterium]|nr:multicopper oxidase domain-containing protein [Candidatus Eremiobacteraeota bacterium]
MQFKRLPPLAAVLAGILACLALAAAFSPLRAAAEAALPSPSGDGLIYLQPQVLPDGTKRFDVTAKVVDWEVTKGTVVRAWTYDGVVPGPVIRVRVGDRVQLVVHNELPEPTVVHLHGLVTKNDMDGVPGVSQMPIPQHGAFTYRFTAVRPGTYIYHTHFNDLDQLDRGLYGAVIIDDRKPIKVDHDYLEVISSWRIRSDAENFFSLNGKAYPETKSLEVKSGQTIRLRFINISGTEFHTMHLHGHRMRIIARDGNPVVTPDVENTVMIGPGQTIDTIVKADANPGTWLLHCHVLDHMMNGNVMPGGLITAVHYEGTPDTLASLGTSMGGYSHGSRGQLSFWTTVLLGCIAGFTIFLGLPIAKLRRVAPQLMSLLNSLAVGVLFFLLFDVIKQASEPIEEALRTAQTGGTDYNNFVTLVIVFVLGIAVGLVGLVYGTRSFMRSAKEGASQNPLMLSMLIATGIGMHNFAEGLAIGQSAAIGAIQLALMLIIGFGLHNATEGFGIAAPLVQLPSVRWRFLLLAGFVGGAPTFIGTIVGYVLVSPTLSVLFLTLAAGAIIFVISEMLHVARRVGFVEVGVIGLALGFLFAYGTDLIITAAGA